jgi:hypothetical protein
MEQNVFDLKDRGGPERKRAGRVWTDEEKRERLTGYLEIPAQYWENVRYGAHVRYCTKKDGYKPGGFVVRNPFDTKARGEAAEKRFMKLQNGFNEKAAGYASWLVAYEDLDQVFVKADAPALVAIENVREAAVGLNENIRKLAKHQKRLADRVGALEQRVAALESGRR